jgi:hypothetical protein
MVCENESQPLALSETYVRRRRGSSITGRRAIVVVDPLSSGALLAQVCDVLAREDTSFESPTEWSGWPGLHAFLKRYLV